MGSNHIVAFEVSTSAGASTGSVVYRCELIFNGDNMVAGGIHYLLDSVKNSLIQQQGFNDGSILALGLRLVKQGQSSSFD